MKVYRIHKVLDLLVEMRLARRVAADFPSFSRISLDLWLHRLFPLVPASWQNARRTIRLRDGIQITYRLNRGDIWSFREVWLYNCYSPPLPCRNLHVLDLGAHIGLTSVWMAKHLDVQRITAVEANGDNAVLARKNLEDNQIDAKVYHAAIGPSDGWANFCSHDESSRGHVDLQASGDTQVLSIATLTRLAGGKPFDLIKMDIEGGEQALLENVPAWLDHVQLIVCELHPGMVDVSKIICDLQTRGFDYVPVSMSNPTSFVRRDGSLSSP